MRQPWRPVVGHEDNYQVSEMGLVQSRKRKGTKGGLINQPINGNGYRQVGIYRNSKIHSFTVHILVAAAFLGPRPPGMQIRHLDGDPLNNNAQNLRYGTPAENAQDQIEHGRHNSSNKTHCPQGHPYSDENTGRTTDGRRRYCKQCKREKMRAWYRRNRALTHPS